MHLSPTGTEVSATDLLVDSPSECHVYFIYFIFISLRNIKALEYATIVGRPREVHALSTKDSLNRALRFIGQNIESFPSNVC